MKMHGEIRLSDKPLQSVDSNEHAGFEFSDFLDRYGYKDEQHHLYTLTESMDLLNRETSEGRHPLVSDVAGQEAHVLVAFRKNEQVVLADPRQGSFATWTTSETESRINTSIQAREAKFAHILTYHKKNEIHSQDEPRMKETRRDY